MHIACDQHVVRGDDFADNRRKTAMACVGVSTGLFPGMRGHAVI